MGARTGRPATATRDDRRKKHLPARLLGVALVSGVALRSGVAVGQETILDRTRAAASRSEVQTTDGVLVYRPLVASGGPRFDPEQLQKALVSSSSRLGACVDGRRQADPDSIDTLELRIDLSRTGTVGTFSNASTGVQVSPVVSHSTLGEPSVDACLLGVVAGITYPEGRPGERPYARVRVRLDFPPATARMQVTASTSALPTRRAGLGVQVQPRDDGLVITGVADGSAAARAGLAEGDLVVAIDQDGATVELGDGPGRSAALPAVEAGQQVALHVVPGAGAQPGHTWHRLRNKCPDPDEGQGPGPLMLRTPRRAQGGDLLLTCVVEGDYQDDTGKYWRYRPSWSPAVVDVWQLQLHQDGLIRLGDNTPEPGAILSRFSLNRYQDDAPACTARGGVQDLNSCLVDLVGKTIDVGVSAGHTGSVDVIPLAPTDDDPYLWTEQLSAWQQDAFAEGRWEDVVAGATALRTAGEGGWDVRTPRQKLQEAVARETAGVGADAVANLVEEGLAALVDERRPRERGDRWSESHCADDSLQALVRDAAYARVDALASLGHFDDARAAIQALGGLHSCRADGLLGYRTAPPTGGSWSEEVARLLAELAATEGDAQRAFRDAHQPLKTVIARLDADGRVVAWDRWVQAALQGVDPCASERDEFARARCEAEAVDALPRARQQLQDGFVLLDGVQGHLGEFDFTSQTFPVTVGQLPRWSRDAPRLVQKTPTVSYPSGLPGDYTLSGDTELSLRSDKLEIDAAEALAKGSKKRQVEGVAVVWVKGYETLKVRTELWYLKNQRPSDWKKMVELRGATAADLYTLLGYIEVVPIAVELYDPQTNTAVVSHVHDGFQLVDDDGGPNLQTKP